MSISIYVLIFLLSCWSCFFFSASVLVFLFLSAFLSFCLYILYFFVSISIAVFIFCLSCWSCFFFLCLCISFSFPFCLSVFLSFCVCQMSSHEVCFYARPSSKSRWEFERKRERVSEKEKERVVEKEEERVVEKERGREWVRKERVREWVRKCERWVKEHFFSEVNVDHGGPNHDFFCFHPWSFEIVRTFGNPNQNKSISN